MTDKQLRILSVAMLLPLAALPASAFIPPGFGEVVLYATNGVHLKGDADVVSEAEVSSGQIVANEAGGTVQIEKKATAAGDVKGDSVVIKKDATVFGDVYYNILANSGTINGSPITPLALPVFVDPPSFFTGPSSGPAVDVPAGTSETLAEGDYGDVTVGVGATLIFTGGTYNVRSIMADNGSTLGFGGLTIVRVAERVWVGNSTTVGSPGVDASDVVFYVAGADGTNEAVEIHNNHQVNANFYAPNGTVHLHKESSARGAFLGYDVIVEKKVRLALASFFFNRPPEAVDDSATTPEDTAVTIDVLANDSAGTSSESADLTIESSTPQNGHTEVVNGQILYTPNPDFYGTESFSYTICDGGDDDDTATDGDDLCDSATVTVTVTPVNDPPAAINQDVVTNGTATIGIVLEGFDVDGDDLTFSIVSGPNAAIGTLGPIDNTAASTATVDYTPVTGNDEENSFVFEVSDGTLTAQAELRINPSSVDPGSQDPPDLGEVLAQDQTLEVIDGTTAFITLRGNAPCELVAPETAAQPCTGLGNDVPLTFTVGTPSSGSLANLTPGTEVPQRTATVEFTPSATGTATFTFTVVGDLNGDLDTLDPGESDTATVTLEVQQATPDGPPVANDVGYKTLIDTPIMINLLGSPSDGQLGDCGRANPQDCPEEGGN